MIERVGSWLVVAASLAWGGWLALSFIQALGKIADALARLATVAERMVQ
jgi:hypothetical protein